MTFDCMMSIQQAACQAVTAAQSNTWASADHSAVTRIVSSLTY
jgi:hypothetical protein